MLFKIKREDIYIYSIIAAICYEQLINIVGIPITAIIGSNSIDTALVIAFTGMTVFYTIFEHSRSMPRSVLFVVCPILLIVFTRIFLPSNYQYMSKDLFGIFRGLLIYVLIVCVYQQGRLKSLLYKIGYLSFIYAVLVVTVKAGFLNIPEADVSYMEFGYFVLPAVVCLFCKYNEEHKIIDLWFVIMSILIILVFGSRGVLFAILMFIIMYRIFIDGMHSAKIYITLAVALLGFVLINSHSFILWFSKILTSVFRYNSRSLTKLLEGTIFSDSGRSLMKEGATKVISERWLFGAGPYADRVLVYFNGGDVASRGYGHYVHNIIYEMMIDFGVPATAVIILTFVLASIYILRNAKTNKEVYICFVSLWLFKLLVSGTFWTEPWFWGTIALIIMQGKEIRQYSGYKVFRE